jgi:hypothetical protein
MWNFSSVARVDAKQRGRTSFVPGEDATPTNIVASAGRDAARSVEPPAAPISLSNGRTD